MIRNNLLTDEAHFTRDGVNNTKHSQLRHQYPHEESKKYQYRLSVNMWCGITGDQNTGPYIFPKRPTCDIHVKLSALLQKVPSRRRQIHFQHDGAPLISVESSGNIWICNSVTDGSVVALRRIGHRGHRIRTRFIRICGVTWKLQCMHARRTRHNYFGQFSALQDA